MAPGKDPRGPRGRQRERSGLLGETRGSLIRTDGNWVRDSRCGWRRPSLSRGFPQGRVPSPRTSRAEPTWILLQPAAKGDPDTIQVWEWKGLAPRWRKGLKLDFFPPFFFTFHLFGSGFACLRLPISYWFNIGDLWPLIPAGLGASWPGPVLPRGAGGPLAAPARSFGMPFRGGIAHRFPAPGTGFLHLPGWWKGLRAGDEPGPVLPPLLGFFCGFRVFLLCPPPPPLFSSCLLKTHFAFFHQPLPSSSRQRG